MPLRALTLPCYFLTAAWQERWISRWQSLHGSKSTKLFPHFIAAGGGGGHVDGLLPPPDYPCRHDDGWRRTSPPLASGGGRFCLSFLPGNLVFNLAPPAMGAGSGESGPGRKYNCHHSFFIIMFNGYSRGIAFKVSSHRNNNDGV